MIVGAAVVRVAAAVALAGRGRTPLPGSALHSPAHALAGAVTRRTAGETFIAFLGASAFPVSALLPATSAVAVVASPADSLAEIRDLGEQSKALREAVRSNGASAKGAVSRGLSATLNPLQAKMAAAVPEDTDAYTQALLMKGHLLELRQALDDGDFGEYVSKTTKRTYPGGKVERELEEVGDTFDDFMRLVTKVTGSAASARTQGVARVDAADLAAAWSGRYADPNHPRGFRDISVQKGTLTITGKDEPEAPQWTLTAKADGDEALIDFSPKGGPKDLVAKLGTDGSIAFPDGNTWTKMGPWAGRYSDPNHPRGYREITVRNGVATIEGQDEPGAAKWLLTAKVEGNEALIDFSPKGGPKDLPAKLGDGKISFPDGNAWPRKH